MGMDRPGRPWKRGQLKAFSATAWTDFKETVGCGRELIVGISGLSISFELGNQHVWDQMLTYIII